MKDIIIGCWQLAGGHGQISQEAKINTLLSYVENGFYTFDCADIYTGVEETLGLVRLKARERYGNEISSQILIHTKCVPDLESLSPECGESISHSILRSIERLQVERLDLVQFHWWDYSKSGLIQALETLMQLQTEGLIEKIGITNFSFKVTSDFVQKGIPIYSTQNQYSLIDNRIDYGLRQLCIKEGIKIFCYGTLAGGFISEKYLGAKMPTGELENRSLIKYLLMIEEIGGWDYFQELLLKLKYISLNHGCSISDIAMSYILNVPGISGIIVGQRNKEHIQSLMNVRSVQLTGKERGIIEQILAQKQALKGDVYELERDREGKHGRIMKYNLSKSASLTKTK